MTVAVRKRDADKVLAAIRRQYAGWIDPKDKDDVGIGMSGPQLVKNFDWGCGVAPYAVVWEGGPYQWTYLAGEAHIDEEFGFKIPAVDFPESVFCEAYTGWALGIYPV